MLQDMMNYFLTKGNPEGEDMLNLKQNILGNFLNQNQYKTNDPLSTNYPWMPQLGPAFAAASGGQAPEDVSPNLRQQMLMNNIMQFNLDRKREDENPNKSINARGFKAPTAPSTSMLDDVIRQSDAYMRGRGFGPGYTEQDTINRTNFSPETKADYVRQSIDAYNRGGDVDARIAPAWYGNRDAMQTALNSYKQEQERFKKVTELVAQQNQLEQDFLNRKRRRPA